MDKFEEFKRAYAAYPSQDTEGYVPERGSFKAGFMSAWRILEAQLSGNSGQLNSSETPNSCSADTTLLSVYHGTLEHLTKTVERDCYEGWTDTIAAAEGARMLLDKQQPEKECVHPEWVKRPGQLASCTKCGFSYSAKESKDG